MECKITSTKRRQTGALLAEWAVAVAVGVLVMAALAAFSLYSTRFYLTIRNCVELDAQARLAVDRMSQEIREADRVVSYDPQKISFAVGTNIVTFLYDNNGKALVRLLGERRTVLLSGCDVARFDIFMRHPTNAVYETFPCATVDNAKVVQITWNCSRTVLGTKQNTESMQSAQVVIRNQGK